MVDGELSQFDGFLRLPQRRHIFIEHKSANNNTSLVPNRNGRVANGLPRPIEALDVEGFVQ